MAGTNQTSEDFLDNSNDNISINKNFICGVVEGFYGRPWTTEQRKDLFAKMKKFGLNAYMYAPKDDLKHRAYWRELYTVEEAEHLTNLIQAAKENGVTFIYALSPGLDVTYSSSKEVSCLKRKLEQVSQFGCNAFALLFDDIEPDISEPDKEVFQSFGHAQVSLSNEVYQHLSQPKFIFCPTEYCTTRAVPNVQNSEYLNIIGSKLLPGIDIMWTGHKVISKIITVQSMQELSEVLKRPPLIWDNLHANDYDQKRLFLGPYCGRAPELVPHLRGVMSNPNCEYETNFIPIHTLGQWSHCKADGKRDMTLNDSITADIKLETESENGSVDDVIPSQMGPNIYHPRKALQVAIRDWLLEFNKNKSAFGKIVTSPFLPNTVIGANPVTPVSPIPAVIVAPNCPTALVNTCMSVTLTTTSALQNLNNPEDPNFHPITTELVNSLVTPSVIPLTSTTASIREPLLSQEGLKVVSISPVNGTSNSSEPMDCNPSPLGSPKNDKASGSESIIDDAIDAEIEEPKITKDNDSAEDMQTEPSIEEDETQSPPIDQSKRLTYDDVALLVDLFYLPFEYGNQGLQFLQDFHWLKSNGHLVANKRAGTSAVREETIRMARNEDVDGEVETGAAITVEEWYLRAIKFEEMTQAINRLSTRLNYIQNRSLLYDLYPYVWDIKGVISLLNSYVKWLALGRVPATSASLYICPPFTWFSKGYKEAFTNGEQEPWLFRGGLTAELQRLLPLESVGDLFLYKPPDIPTSKIYTIRPYLPADEESVYHLCRKTCDDGADGSDVFPDMPNLIGDKLIGGYLCLSPEYCFVIEDEEGICGYCVAALDAKEFHCKLEMAWIPELRSKYPLNDLNDVPNKSKSEDLSSAMLTPAEEMIASFHNPKPFNVIPDEIYTSHPSILKLSMASSVSDPSIPKRLMACVFSALKANGSHGVFCEVTIGDKNILDIYAKLGFMEIPLPGFTTQDVFYLGRTF